MQELRPGVFHYRVWRPGSFKGVSFNGTYLVGEQERVLIDPPPLNAWEREHLEALGAPTLILVTNANHVRAAAELRQETGAKLLVPEADAERIAVEVDGTFSPGETVAGLEVIGLADHKTPGESAFYDPERKLLILGDALIGTPGGGGVGGLSLLPDAKFADPAKAREGLRVLLEREVETLVLGDGESLLKGAREALLSFFCEVPEVPLVKSEHGQVPEAGKDGWFVLNLSEAEWSGNDDYGNWCSFEGQRSRFQEVGVNVTVVNPGQPACLYHRESTQEGYFVLEGEATLLIEDQERPLRQWDYVHLPPGAAHVLVGAGSGPAAVLMLGARPLDCAIQYPSSDLARKHGAGTDRTYDTPEEAYGSIPGLTRPTPRSFRWPLS